jgi:hypothetical protein
VLLGGKIGCGHDLAHLFHGDCFTGKRLRRAQCRPEKATEIQFHWHIVLLVSNGHRPARKNTGTRQRGFEPSQRVSRREYLLYFGTIDLSVFRPVSVANRRLIGRSTQPDSTRWLSLVCR